MRSGGHAADFGGALERPGGGFFAQLVGAGRVLGEERDVGVAFFEEDSDEAPARSTRSVPGRGCRNRSLCRASVVARGSITTSFAPRSRASFRNGIDVNAGGRRIDAPHDDQPRLGIVLVARPTASCRRARDWRRRSARRTPFAAAATRRGGGRSVASVVSCVSRPFEPP